MESKRTEILSLIAGQPNIRLIEIADKLDIEPNQIQPQIQDIINDGRIIRDEVMAPNHRMQPCYRYAEFTSGVKPAAEMPDIDVPVTRKVPAIPTVPVFGKPKTKIDIAIEYLRENAPASTPFLARAIGLREKDSPNAYIATAIRDKRIAQNENKDWILGPAITCVSPAETLRVAVDLTPTAGYQMVTANTFPVPVPCVAEAGLLSNELNAKATPAPVKVAEPAAANPVADPVVGRFVAGLFSNGELHIDVNGQDVIINPENTRKLYAYLNKIGPVMLA